MVFNFLTVDLSEDSVDFAALAPPESPSTTSCDCTCTKTIVTRVLASAPRVLTVPVTNAGCARPSNPLEVSDVILKSKLRRFTLKELQVATYNFSDMLRVGKGGFGNVYKGLLPDGSFVAIKRLSRSSCQGLEEFKAEIVIHSIVTHRNLVPAIGFCVSNDSGETILVYLFKVNGNLHSRLQKPQSQPPLDWPTRKRILLGAARGLSYLHNNGIIHRDIKPSNILLDENLEGCIGDFGLAKILDKNDQVSSSKVQNHTLFNEYTETYRVIGTYGYMAPEYAKQGVCSVKIDVFSFGVTILDVVIGRKAPYSGSAKNGKEISWIKNCLNENGMDKLIDRDLLNDCYADDVKKIIQLGLACTLVYPKKRPSMFQVVQVFEGACLRDVGIDTDFIMGNTVQAHGEWSEDYLPNDLNSMTDSIARLASEELSGPR